MLCPNSQCHFQKQLFFSTHINFRHNVSISYRDHSHANSGSSTLLAPASPDRWEPILSISSLCIQWCQLGSWKSVTVEVFILWKLANAANLSFPSFPLQSHFKASTSTILSEMYPTHYEQNRVEAKAYLHLFAHTSSSLPPLAIRVP